MSVARAPILWLMGPTSAGKTTISESLVARLRGRGRGAILHDGDQVRDYFGDLIGFGADDRIRVVSTLIDLAERTADAGLVTVVAALTAHDDARERVRAMVPRPMIVHVSCAIDACIARDPKGLYRQAIDGEIDTLIGYNQAYRPPEDPDLVIETDALGVDECVDAIVAALETRAATS